MLEPPKTPLRHAATIGDIRAIEECLQTEDVNQSDGYVLYMAAVFRQRESIRTLARAGASFDLAYDWAERVDVPEAMEFLREVHVEFAPTFWDYLTDGDG